MDDVYVTPDGTVWLNSTFSDTDNEANPPGGLVWLGRSETSQYPAAFACFPATSTIQKPWASRAIRLGPTPRPGTSPIRRSTPSRLHRMGPSGRWAPTAPRTEVCTTSRPSDLSLDTHTGPSRKGWASPRPGRRSSRTGDGANRPGRGESWRIGVSLPAPLLASQCDDAAMLRVLGLVIAASVLAAGCAGRDASTTRDDPGRGPSDQHGPLRGLAVATPSGVLAGAVNPSRLPPRGTREVAFYLPLDGDWTITVNGTVMFDSED